MSKAVYRVRLGDYWLIGEHESWFSDMAQRGLHIDKMGIFFAKFKRGEPRNTRYRIDISQGSIITQEQMSLYLENGWTYVTSYRDFNVFSSPADEDIPELHTDPAEQAYTLSYLNQKLKAGSLLVTASSVLMIIMIFAYWFIDSTPYLSLIEGMIIQQVLAAIAVLYTVYGSLQAAISITSLKKTLSEGREINHSAPWRRKRSLNIMVSVFFISIAFLSALIPFIQIGKSKTEALPEESIELPIVRLADIEKDPDLRQKPSPLPEIMDFNNRYSYDWSIIAPLQYESREEGVIANEMWKDGSGIYSPSIETRIYRINFPSMREGILSDLIKRYGYIYEGGAFIEKEHRSFDKLIIHEEDSLLEVFAAKGKGIVYVRYHGYADVDSVVEAAKDKISLISD